MTIKVESLLSYIREGGLMPKNPQPQEPEFEMKRVEVEDENEFWNEYKLEDGTVLRVKLVVAQVKKSVDKPIPNSSGEPLYSIKADTVVDADVDSDELFDVEEE